ncbi:MAG: trypsin-like peptidase domain-containing protein [Roseburia sp.]|nr:trypsin-like peptidase domain-containing protein [Roseburia sp.]
MKKLIKIIAGAVVFGVLSGAVFQGVNRFCDQSGSVQSGSGKTVTADVEETAVERSVEATGITQTSSNTGNEIAGVSDVAEKVLPSIVAIDVKVVSRQQDFFGRVYESEGEGSGSGIIIKEDSDNVYIVTNNHVVADSVKVTITFSDETTAEAVVTGTDEVSDLAVVKVAKSDLKDETMSQIKTAVLADSDKIKVGEQAIAVGNALGYGTSVTVGYVSAKEREIGISTEDEDSLSGRRGQTSETSSGETMKLIQTDAAINPGNSGGALVNANGEVIGINSSKFASEEVEGMGFAIPISDALPVIEKLMNITF